ncbi:hypothetical protein [Nocardia sp. NBC_00416]|uniref:hypothetical protein n=1 Tax=Nocardia sp. NBC_00416 TaxID=2975991 RepID=UPI002E242212
MTDSGDSRSADGALGADERRELARLRAELARLRREQPGAGTGSRRARWTAVVVLLVLVGFLLVAAVAARYTRSEILDTDRYVSTVAPLGADPAVKGAVTDRVTEAIVTRLDIEAVAAEALTELSRSRPRLEPVVGLAPVLAEQAETFVRDTVSELVDSDRFEDLWVQANRAAHTRLVAVVTGDTRSGAIEVDDTGTVSISLDAVLAEARTRLSQRGFTFTRELPPLDEQFVLFRSPELASAQRIVGALDKAAGILPWAAALAAAVAVWAAPRGSRLRALAAVGVTCAVAMAVLALAIYLGRSLYLGDLPPEIRSPAAATAVFDTLVAPLRSMLRAVFVAGLVVAAAGYLLGGSDSASALRRTWGRFLAVLRRPGGTRPPTAFQLSLARARVPLRAAIVAAGVAIVVFWNYPTGAVVGWTVLLALIALVLLELAMPPTIARSRSGAREGSETS